MRYERHCYYRIVIFNLQLEKLSYLKRKWVNFPVLTSQLAFEAIAARMLVSGPRPRKHCRIPIVLAWLF